VESLSVVQYRYASTSDIIFLLLQCGVARACCFVVLTRNIDKFELVKVSVFVGLVALDVKVIGVETVHILPLNFSFDYVLVLTVSWVKLVVVFGSAQMVPNLLLCVFAASPIAY
jgi:hypothetical protein